jgi:hypothetical protein
MGGKINMTQKKLIAVVIFLASFFYGCNSGNNKMVFGKYVFDEIIYASSLSSSSIDYIKEQMEGTEFAIEKDSFEIVSSNTSYKISKPNYTRKKMDDDLVQSFNNAVFDAVPISEYKEKYLYIIHTKEDEKANYYLYSMDDEIWIASYADNTSNNTYIIMYIFKIKIPTS